MALLYQVSGSTGSPTKGFNEFQRASNHGNKGIEKLYGG